MYQKYFYTIKHKALLLPREANLSLSSDKNNML